MLVVRGSKNYNLHTKESDEDYVDLYFPSLEDLWYDRKPKQNYEADVQLMDVRHFLYLLEKGNVSALELLYAVDYSNEASAENNFYRFVRKHRGDLMLANRSGFYWSVFGAMKSEMAWLRKNRNELSGKRMAQVLRWYYLLESTKDPSKLYQNTEVYVLREEKKLSFREPVNPFFLLGSLRSEVLDLKLDKQASFDSKEYLMEAVFDKAEKMFEFFNTSNEQSALFEKLKQKAYGSFASTVSEY